MKLETTNDNVMNYSKVVSLVTTKGKKGRAVAKFNKLLAPFVKEYEENQVIVVKENGGVVSEEGKIDWETVDNAINGNKALGELSNESITIDLTEYETFVESLIESLYDDVGDMNGKTLEEYDNLLEKLEALQ